MLTSSHTRGLFSDRFWRNFFPVPATHQLPVGTAAPAFELLDVTHNRSVRLADYAASRRSAQATGNRPVLLCFTRIFTEQIYCPLCYPHIVALNQSYAQFTQRGAEVLMITSTDLPQSQQIVEQLGLTLPLLSDPSCEVFRRYGVGQALGAPLPAQFLIDPAGRIRFRHLFSFLEPNASIERLLVALDRIKGVGAVV